MSKKNIKKLLNEITLKYDVPWKENVKMPKSCFVINWRKNLVCKRRHGLKHLLSELGEPKNDKEKLKYYNTVKFCKFLEDTENDISKDEKDEDAEINFPALRPLPVGFGSTEKNKHGLKIMQWNDHSDLIRDKKYFLEGIEISL